MKTIACESPALSCDLGQSASSSQPKGVSPSFSENSFSSSNWQLGNLRSSFHSVAYTEALQGPHTPFLSTPRHTADSCEVVSAEPCWEQAGATGMFQSFASEAKLHLSDLMLMSHELFENAVLTLGKEIHLIKGPWC